MRPPAGPETVTGLSRPLKFLGLRPTLTSGGLRRAVAALEHEVPERGKERLTLVIIEGEHCDKNRKARPAPPETEIARAKRQKQLKRKGFASFRRDPRAPPGRPRSIARARRRPGLGPGNGRLWH